MATESCPWPAQALASKDSFPARLRPHTPDHFRSPTAGSFLASRLAEAASYATTRPSSETKRPCGIRIDAAMLPSVFHLFPQASTSIELIQHLQGGLGIKRTLVRSRLEKHSGSNTAHKRTAKPVHGLNFVTSGTLGNDPAPTAR